ncbi:MAG: hypothetical protein OXR68_03520 [Alphaproteobacteria bacterium]|nr:hypothetical protein [Alphaproteobacteria bacterium]MDD9919676.1 hypothetical protein [Alphaproteobacteria bacterium]
MTTSKTPITKNIICMKWGTRYGPEYVNRLFATVQKHMSGTVGEDYRFICITDDPTGIVEGVECKPLAPLNDDLPDHLKNKPWLKLLVWDNPLYDLEGDALFLDVDLIITGSLDDFFAYKPESTFCVIENWTEPGKSTGNTSVFRFRIGAHPYILHDFVKDMWGTYKAYKIEQRYISRTISEQTFWPAEWCRSFKVHLIPTWPWRFFVAPKLPESCRIVVFHGKPDPDEAMIGRWPTKQGQWYKKIYKYIRPTSWIADHWQDPAHFK